MGYRFNSKETRDKLAERDGGYFCAYCGAELIEDNQLAKHVIRIGRLTIISFIFPPDKKQITVDHVVPRSKGGSHKLENLVLCCGSCNSSKGCKHG